MQTASGQELRSDGLVTAGEGRERGIDEQS